MLFALDLFKKEVEYFMIRGDLERDEYHLDKEDELETLSGTTL
jgi:hypothetical protein